MAQKFDPYHKWLGIPPKDQPPHFYRLLGVDLFESDPEVIEAAANRQMAYIQDCATGEKVAASQKLLNEITQARLTLLAIDKRNAYDRKLKKRLAASSDADLAASVIPAKPLAVAQPLDDKAVLSTPVISPASPKPAKSLPGQPALGQAAASFDFSKKRTSAPAAASQKKVSVNWRFPVFLLVFAGLIIGGIVVAQSLPGWLQQSTDLGDGKVVVKKDALEDDRVAESESVDGGSDSASQPGDVETTAQDDEETPTIDKADNADAGGQDVSRASDPTTKSSLFRGESQGPDPLAGPVRPDDLPDEVFRGGEDEGGGQQDPGDDQLPGGMIPVDAGGDVVDAPEAGGDEPGQGEVAGAAADDGAAAEEAVQRLPLPDDEAIGLLLRQVNRDYRAPTSRREDKLVMAQTMIDHAEVADSIVQYALLDAASHMAVAGRDLALAMEAVQKLVERFETDGYRLRVDLLREVGRPSSASAAGSDLLKQELLLLLDEVTQQDRQELVPEVLEMVAALADRWRDADLQKALDDHRDE